MTPTRALALGRQRYPSRPCAGADSCRSTHYIRTALQGRREVVRIRRIERMGAKSLAYDFI